MWLILSLIALLFWSGSDLFSKIGSKPDDKLSHWKMVMMVGLVMGLHAMFEIFVSKTPISLDAIITYLPASLLYIFSMILGYVGLRYIELSISSPICNSSGAISAILCFFVLGQRLEPMQAVAVILICIGVISLGIAEYTEDDEKRRLRQSTANVKYSKSVLAILLPVLYCLLDAAGTFVDSIILDTDVAVTGSFVGGVFCDTGSVYPSRFLNLLLCGRLEESTANVAYELTFLFMGIIAAIYVLIIKRDRLTVKRDTPKLIGGVCETIGQFAYVFAIAAYPIGAAPVISAYCIASVIWSSIFLKEKLSPKHYFSIVIAILGIVLLALYEGLSGDV